MEQHRADPTNPPPDLPTALPMGLGALASNSALTQDHGGAGSVLKQWGRATRWPGGRWLFGRTIGWRVPYAGTVAPRVLDLDSGYARVGMSDRRAVRNHLRSIHAIALVNLGELTANLALMTRQPRHGRWIVTGVEVVYSKKARGRIVAVCRLEQPLDWSCPQDAEGCAELFDSGGERVAVVRQRWRLGPRKG